MIRSFKSKVLRKFWERSDASGLRPDWVGKVTRFLDALDAATKPEDINLPGARFHALSSNLAGRFAILISHNWRITFGWAGEDAIDVDLEDYHGK